MKVPYAGKQLWRAWLLGGLLTTVVTLLVPRPLGQALEFLSFDCAFLFRPAVDFRELVIIDMDQKSHEDLRQVPGIHWDRYLHARLVTRDAGRRAVDRV